MADKYSATSLAQSADPLEIQKADLDLLKKINEVNSTLSDAKAADVKSLQDQIDALKAGSFTPGKWTPYPAGTYVFPSGNITSPSGALPIGAEITAPTFGGGVTSFAYYKDNGNKTIDIILYYSSTTAGVSGTGTYIFPLPLGYSFNPDFVIPTSDGWNGSCIGTGRIVAASGALRAVWSIGNFNTTSMYTWAYYGSEVAAGVFKFVSSSYFGLANDPKITYSVTCHNIPIL